MKENLIQATGLMQLSFASAAVKVLVASDICRVEQSLYPPNPAQPAFARDVDIGLWYAVLERKVFDHLGGARRILPHKVV